MKEYLLEFKFILGILFIILSLIIYKSSYFLSEETISSVKVFQPHSIENSTINSIKN